jgi:hypothetical protein
MEVSSVGAGLGKSGVIGGPFKSTTDDQVNLAANHGRIKSAPSQFSAISVRETDALRKQKRRSPGGKRRFV